MTERSAPVSDGDDAGRELNAAVSRELPGVVRVELPAGRDVRDVLLRTCSCASIPICPPPIELEREITR